MPRAAVQDHVGRRYSDILLGTVARDWVGRDTPGLTAQGALVGGEDAITFGQGIDIGDVVLKRDPINRNIRLVLVMQALR